jgi:hypothetical protein
MRAVIRQAILADTALQTLGIVGDDHCLSGDVDSFAARPFINLKWGTTNPSPFGNVATQTTLVAWVHDNPNDYERIDAILRRLRVFIPSLVGLTDVNDYVSQAAWTGDGPDLKDDGHRTIVRVGNYTLNGSML